MYTLIAGVIANPAAYSYLINDHSTAIFQKIFLLNKHNLIINGAD